MERVVWGVKGESVGRGGRRGRRPESVRRVVWGEECEESRVGREEGGEGSAGRTSALGARDVASSVCGPGQSLGRVCLGLGSLQQRVQP